VNKRQKKKRKKNINERVWFFHPLLIIPARQNGKTSYVKRMNRAIFSKHYYPFKEMKRIIMQNLRKSRSNLILNIVRDSRDRYFEKIWR
jgi:hypothetical protein